MIFDEAINAMSAVEDKRSLIIDMSDYYVEWSRSCSECKDQDKFVEQFCSIVNFIDKENIKQKFADEMNPVFSVSKVLIKLLKEYPLSFKEYDIVIVTNKKFTEDALFVAEIFNKEKLSKLADFTDENSGVFTHVNHDVVLAKIDNTYVIKNNKKRIKSDIIVIIDAIEDFESMELYPRGLPYYAPIKLNHAHLAETIRCNENNSIIEINGFITVTAKVPITLLQNCETLTIKGEGELHLICKEGQQPCIGCETYTGMSYGRWSPGIRPNCNKIIVDGVKVVCKSKVDAFSIGQYGTNYCPEIECINGGSIDCPETDSQRYIEYHAMAPAGSTKISEAMKYNLRRFG